MSYPAPIEDSLSAELADYLSALLTGTLPAGLPIVHFRQTADLPVNCVVVGHEGSVRVSGQDGTAHVNLRLAVKSSLDEVEPETHSAAALAIEGAVMGLALGAGTLPLSFLHAVHRVGNAAQIAERRQLTLLSFRITATRCVEA
jgi:hypothetical protein